MGGKFLNIKKKNPNVGGKNPQSCNQEQLIKKQNKTKRKIRLYNIYQR